MNGNRARWSQSTRSSIWTALWSRFGRTSASSTRPSTWPWASICKATRSCWACGCPENEGAKFWLGVLTELQNRGVKDILIACVDGLKGFPDAISAVYPQAQIQLCIVHMVRNSMKYVPYKDYKTVTADLKHIYQSATEQEALQELEQFAGRWDDKYPHISRSWRTHWPNLNTLFRYPEDIRRAIYTTNAIESLNSVIRKAINKRKLFPTDDSARKVLYLAIMDASKKWTMPIRNWKPALNRFIVEFEDRISDYV